MPYETVMREACGVGCHPIAVFATEKAMETEILPLSDALNTFVRLDNRHFKQELSQSSRIGHKRSAGLGDGSQSKRLQRSVSLDSMATNHASVGDFDDDMRDAPFDNDSMFGAVGEAAADRAAAQDDNIPSLVEFPPLPGVPGTLPSYPKDIEMEGAVSPPLAQVSLRDMGSSIPTWPAREMQERPNSLFLTRPNNEGGAAANGRVDDEEPLIDLNDGKEEQLIDLGDDNGAGSKAQVNGI